MSHPCIGGMHDVVATDDASIGIDVVDIFGSSLFIDGEGRSVGFDGELIGVIVQEFIPDGCH